MTPCYFGAADAELFGMYAAPRPSVARAASVLLCAPIGIEYMRTHYALRLLAIQLANAGFHVLRFDYHGTGDSTGSIGPGQFDHWLDDVALAAHELGEISGVTSLSVVGLRTGALLAVAALASRRFAAQSLVLWEPVVSGADYLAALEQMHNELAAQRRQPPLPSDELMGARFPADLRDQLGAFSMDRRLEADTVGRVALVVSEDRHEYRALLAALRARWPAVDYRQLDDAVEWQSIEAAFDARLTSPIVRAVAEATEAGTP